MLQWASGGMLFLWFTFRSGEISVGYAKLLRGVYATIALGGAALGFVLDRIIIREVAALVLVALAIVGFARRDTVLDRLATAAGFVGVGVAALSVDNQSDALWLVRLIVGAVFLGAISDAMLLGHWYLVQPGMPRKLLDTSRINALGWYPSITLGDGLAATYDWYLENSQRENSAK